MILGHGHPAVVKAVQDAAARGLSYGAPTEAEVIMAEELLKLVPSMQQLRLVSSGTEAAMSAIRLARGAAGAGKGRRKIIKSRCYHGHADSLLVKAGSGLLTFGNPSSAGVPAEITQHTWYSITTSRSNWSMPSGSTATTSPASSSSPSPAT